MKGKKVAIFGLRDQVKYPESFVDGIGILAEIFEYVGVKIIGFTSILKCHERLGITHL